MDALALLIEMQIKKCVEQRLSREQLKTLSQRALLLGSTFRKRCQRKGGKITMGCVKNKDMLFVLHGRLVLSLEQSFSVAST